MILQARLGPPTVLIVLYYPKGVWVGSFGFYVRWGGFPLGSPLFLQQFWWPPCGFPYFFQYLRTVGSLPVPWFLQHWKWVPMVLQPVLPRCVSGVLPWLLQHVSWVPAGFPCFLLHGLPCFLQYLSCVCICSSHLSAIYAVKTMGSISNVAKT